MSEECPIIEDLLPLYKKQMLQASTLIYVEQHLAKCPHCQQLFSSVQMQKESIPMKKKYLFSILYLLYFHSCLLLTHRYLETKWALSFHMPFSVVCLTFFIKTFGLFLSLALYLYWYGRLSTTLRMSSILPPTL